MEFVFRNVLNTKLIISNFPLFAIYAIKIAKLAQEQTITTVSIVKSGQRKMIQAQWNNLSIVLKNVLLVLTKANRVFAWSAIKIAKPALDQTITTVSIVKLGRRTIIWAY